MLTSIRQNPAIRALPKWLAVSAVSAGLLMNVIIARKQVADPMTMAIVLWVAVATWLIFGEVRTRCTPFDMALPISSRKLWLSHIIAVAFSGVAILTVTAGLFSGLLWLLWKLTGRSFVSTPGLGGQAAHLCAGLILAVVLLQNPHPTDHTLQRTRERMALAILVMAAVLAVVVLLHQVSPWASFATLALAATVGLYRYRSVPPTFTLSTLDAGGAAAVRLGSAEAAAQWDESISARPRSAASFQRFLNWTVWRCFYVGVRIKHSPWATIPFLIFFGALMSGFEQRWLEFSLRLQIIPMAVFVLFSFSTHPLKTLYLLDAVPVSRKRLLNVLLVFYMAALIAGYGVGFAAMAVLERARPSMVEVVHLIQSRDDGNFYVYVPYEALEVIRRGEPPEPVAPWGETHEAWSRSLWRNSAVKMYSPYHTPVGSSIDYTAWQISRATGAVYGETISPDEIKRRYLEERADGSARLKDERLTIQRDYPHLRRDLTSGPVFPIVIGIVFVVWMLSLSIYLQTFRAGISKNVRSFTAVALMGLMMLWWIAEFVSPIVRLVQTLLVNAFVTIWLRRVGESVTATTAIWIVVLAVSAAAYWMALNRYQRAEAPYDREAGGAG